MYTAAFATPSAARPAARLGGSSAGRLHGARSMARPVTPSVAARRSVRPVMVSAGEATGPKPAMNSKWPTGVPPIMGGHLMGSGVVAPTSTSTSAGVGVYRHMFQYDDDEVNTTVLVHADAADAARGLAALVQKASAAAIAEKGSFTIALSGGSMISALGSLAGGAIEWDKWHVFWADERCVPLDSADSNFKGASDEFLSKTGIPPNQIYTIDPSLPAPQAAAAYEARMTLVPPEVLPRAGDFPQLDMVLLGVGPDGHVASLFPNRAAVAETSSWVVGVTNSPKPPPSRITLSLPVINAAKEAVLFSCGAGKAEIVQRVLEVQSLPGALPAQLVAAGAVTWVVDAGAASSLTPAKWNDPKAYPRSDIPPLPKKKKAA